jgi:phosphate transport system permease protein
MKLKANASDLALRLGSGAFALVLVLIVVGIGWVLWDEARLSVAKFGFAFWSRSHWDPVSGEFGAFPFIWGTLYSSILRC